MNFLNLNENRTEIIMFRGNPSDFPDGSLSSIFANICPSIKNLGVILHSAFKFDSQISSVIKNCFFFPTKASGKGKRPSISLRL